MMHHLISRLFDEYPGPIVLVSAFDDTIEYLNPAWTHGAGIVTLHASSPGKSIRAGLPDKHPILLALLDGSQHCQRREGSWVVASVLASAPAQRDLVLAGSYPVDDEAEAQAAHARTASAVASVLEYERLAQDLDSIATCVQDALGRCDQLTSALAASLFTQ